MDEVLGVWYAGAEAGGELGGTERREEGVVRGGVWTLALAAVGFDAVFQPEATVAVAGVAAETAMELPRGQEVQVGVQRPEEDNAALVHVGELLVELFGRVVCPVAQLDRPPLKYYLARIAGMTLRPRRRGGRAACKRIGHIPALASIVDKHQRLIQAQPGRIDVYLYDHWRRPDRRTIQPLPLRQVVLQRICLIHEDVELPLVVSPWSKHTTHKLPSQREQEQGHKQRATTSGRYKGPPGPQGKHGAAVLLSKPATGRLGR
jgi:hypothetical protein